jgi:hypothetical protein
MQSLSVRYSHLLLQTGLSDNGQFTPNSESQLSQLPAEPGWSRRALSNAKTVLQLGFMRPERGNRRIAFHGGRIANRKTAAARIAGRTGRRTAPAAHVRARSAAPPPKKPPQKPLALSPASMFLFRS